MSTTPITLPPIPGPVPALPQGANHDQQMAHHAAQMRRWEAEVAVLRFRQAEQAAAQVAAQIAQAERLNTAAETRSAALTAAHAELARQQGRSATAMESMLSGGIPSDDEMVRAINALGAAIAAAGGAPGQGAAPAAGDVDRMVALVSTMTSTQRQNPAAAAAAAAAQLAAVRGQG